MTLGKIIYRKKVHKHYHFIRKYAILPHLVLECSDIFDTVLQKISEICIVENFDITNLKYQIIYGNILR